MRNIFLIIIAAVILLGFVFFMTTYTVRFTDVAIVSTFGSAGDDAKVDQPGLKFKWPAPIQSTTIYDNRVRLLKGRSETQQTADQRQIVVGAFLTWRIADPIQFYKSYAGEGGSDPTEHYRQAERTLEPMFRSAMSEVSRFNMSDLFARGDASRIKDLETAVLQRLTAQSQDGIAVEMVGISSIELPEQTTQAAFEQMRTSRQTLAADAEAEGNARAEAIRKAASNDAQKILSFVSPYVAQILARGESDAARWIQTMNQEPRLAAFLERTDLMRRGFGKRVTLILDSAMTGLELFGADGADKILNNADDNQ